jgi:hypothetical protein
MNFMPITPSQNEVALANQPAILASNQDRFAKRLVIFGIATFTLLSTVAWVTLLASVIWSWL